MGWATKQDLMLGVGELTFGGCFREELDDLGPETLDHGGILWRVKLGSRLKWVWGKIKLRICV